MRMRAFALVATATTVLIAPHALAAGPAPQVTDPSGDGNFVNAQGESAPVPGVSAPFGSQAYGDATSVLWQPYQVKKGRKKVFGGFTVTTTLSAPPVPPSGTTLVYRMLGQVNGDATLFLGPVYYTTKGSDPAQPQSALRDNLDGATRLTPLALPKIAGNTLTWTVPVSALPKTFKVGSTLSNLYFEIREIEDFHGAAVPTGVPVYGGATGLGAGIVDNGSSTNSFKVG
jgi:hypothetical protein